MKNTRITYHWLYDMLYTMIWSFIISTVFVLIFNLVFHFGKFNLTPYIVINLLIVPLATIFIGIRPLFNLFAIPDTLYKKEGGNLYLISGEKISVENIKQINIKQVGLGRSHMLYYEIILKSLPPSLINRKRKSLIFVEKYNIRFSFKTKTDLLLMFEKIGLEENKIIWNSISLKNTIGIRDKFSK